MISEKEFQTRLTIFNPSSTNNYIIFEKKNMKVFYEDKELF